MANESLRDEVVSHLESLGFRCNWQDGRSTELSHEDGPIYAIIWGANELQLDTSRDQVFTNLRSSEFSDVRDAVTSCLELLLGTTQGTKRRAMESEDILTGLIERSKQREG